MEGELLTVIIVVATALAFDFTNGFHDTANVVATSISTRAMAPRIAVGRYCWPSMTMGVPAIASISSGRVRLHSKVGAAASTMASAGKIRRMRRA